MKESRFPKGKKSAVSGPGDEKKVELVQGSGLSRRQLMGGAAAAAMALPLIGSLSGKADAGQAAQGGQAPAAGQAPNAAGRGGAGGGRGGGGAMPQGGRGPIRVLLVTKFHPFERGPFFDMFDSFGDIITWTLAEQPAAEAFMNPKLAAPYDVLVFYDMAGRDRGTTPAGTVGTIFPPATPEMKQGWKDLLRSGNKGFVFFHHSVASWLHNDFPEYCEIIGGAADWGLPITVRGKEYPYSGFLGDVPQHVTIQDKTHPVVQGVGDASSFEGGYDITDEVYLCPMFEDSVHCLLRTDFKPVDANFPMQSGRGWHHPPGSNMSGWVKTAENSPVVYIQHGHGPSAWSNRSFQRLMTNAIQWVNTKDAKDWAKANPSKIFA